MQKVKTKKSVNKSRISEALAMKILVAAVAILVGGCVVMAVWLMNSQKTQLNQNIQTLEQKKQELQQLKIESQTSKVENPALEINNQNQEKHIIPQQLCSENTCFDLEIAQTSQERQIGLMNRDHLPEFSGMLFVFPQEKNNRFWMKNTLIPLDIIWLDEDFKVLYIANATPCGEENSKKNNCTSYGTSALSRYILEINSGLTEEYGMEVGSVLSSTIPN